MRILVLGRDGQVGTALTAILAPLGEVTGYGREGADLSHPESVAELVRHKRPDIVVNAAAYTAVDKAESEPDLARVVNAEAPAALAEAVAAIGGWLIHYSTDYVYDGLKSSPYLEDDPTAPLNVYGRTKLEGEAGVAKAGAKHLIFRTSWVHAPVGRSFAARMLKLAAERDSLQVIDDQIGAPTSARLIADITQLAIGRISAERPIVAGVYHLQAGGETSWNGYARFVIQQALARGATLRARPDTVEKVPTSAFATAARRPLNSRLSTHKLRAALDIDLPDWHDDVMGTIETLVPEQAA
jgi:dTDP-4-dehydrorhamnose reductase